MKKIISALIFSLIAASALFATGKAPESKAGVDLKVDSPTTINYIGWRFPITQFYADELESLNKVPNLTTNAQLLDSGSAKEQARLALSGSGTSPYQIIHVDDALINELAAEGWLYPLDDLIAKYREQYDLDDIPQGMYEIGSLNGKVYGIPMVANTMHYFYNMEVFDKYGLEVPETYDDVIAMAPTLKKSGLMPFTINLHAGWAWRIEFHNFLNAYGGKWLNADSSAAFNGPEGVKAVEKILEVVDATMGKEGLTWSIDDSEIGLETGTLASATIWASRAPNMDNPEKSMFVGKIGFAPAPRVVKGGPHAGPAAMDYLVIPASSGLDPDLIFRVIMEMTDFESQVRAAEYGLITRSKVAKQADGRYVAAALETIANGAGNYGFNPAVKLARIAIENILPQVLNERDNVQGVLDRAAAEYTKNAKKQGYL